MSKANDNYDLEPEYDLGSMKVMAKGRYAPERRAGKNVVLLESDLAAAFPNDAAVNEALRLVLKAATIPTQVKSKPKRSVKTA